MSGRTILSRPRTRVYDANYNIGESYYRPALDRLDRKYSGRPLSPPRQSATARDIAERHASAFADEDLDISRKRAEKHITEDHVFDSRGARIGQRALGMFENGLEDETTATLKRIRANKKVSIIDDVDLESTSNNLKTHRLIDRSEKLLDSIGISDNSRRALDEDVSIKRRSLRVAASDETGDLTKWSPLAEERETAASLRARQSRDRITDIEEEMAANAEKQAARERRFARLKALVAESEEESESTQAVKSLSISARSEKKTVHF